MMVIFRELLPNPGSGVAVNDEKRHTDIAYLVTDEGYPPKITHFCRHWPQLKNDN
jgi:hypothetical protein